MVLLRRLPTNLTTLALLMVSLPWTPRTTSHSSIVMDGCTGTPAGVGAGASEVVAGAPVLGLGARLEYWSCC